MTKPRLFTSYTALQPTDLVPFVRDLGGGDFGEGNIPVPNLKADLANPTTLTMPIQIGGVFVDSFVTYNTMTEEYTTTKDWIFPAASVWLGQSLHLHNSGNILGIHDHINDTESLAVDRPYDENGSNATIPVILLEPAEWFIFQPVSTDTKTITGSETIDFVE